MKFGVDDLREFVNCKYFVYWDEDNRSCGGSGMIRSDPERFERCQKAAELGAEGSTHAEIIQDQRHALEISALDWESQDRIGRELDAVEEHHKKMGTLDTQVG